MTVVITDRLILRKFTVDDADLIVELLNDSDWLRFIGDRGIRNGDDARAYIRNGPMAMYDRLGFGLYLTALKDTGQPIGMCGLIKRDTLPDVDLGFAFLPNYRGSGYARESAMATLLLARQQFGLDRIVAITSMDNHRSIALLERIGFAFESELALSGSGVVRLFGISLSNTSIGAGFQAKIG